MVRLNAYGRLCSQFYDIDKPHPPVSGYEFYLTAARAAGGPVLEPMCGSGRYLVPLLRAGVDIDGFDASPEMLAASRERGRALGLTPKVELGLLGDYQPPRVYTLAFVPAGSFCLLTDPAIAARALASLYAALVPGGRLLLEVERFSDDGSLDSGGHWTGRWVERSDGARIVISGLTSFDARKRVSFGMNRYDLVKDGVLLETEYEELDLRVYDEDEFLALLVDAGFERGKVVEHYSPHAEVRAGGFIVEAYRQTG